MTDLTITRSGELDVSHVQANTDSGTEFVDAWTPPGDMSVVDSGRIIIPTADVANLEHAATERGLTIDREESL